MPPVIYSKSAIRSALMPAPSRPGDEPIWPAKSPQEFPDRLKAILTKNWLPAAVLIGLIERDTGLSVLLTQRAHGLRDHAGQVSFPGGRAEPEDRDPWNTALREAREEVGLDPDSVEFGGFLPDHYVGTGFRVTPAVGFIKPDFNLTLDAAEVHDVFEAPLDFLFDAKNQGLRKRSYGDSEVHFHDIHYESRNIWGATAGMLMTLQSLVDAKAKAGMQRA